MYILLVNSEHFVPSGTFGQFETIQRRLAWPLH
jgi:hypothetical protein